MVKVLKSLTGLAGMSVTVEGSGMLPITEEAGGEEGERGEIEAVPEAVMHLVWPHTEVRVLAGLSSSNLTLICHKDRQQYFRVVSK